MKKSIHALVALVASVGFALPALANDQIQSTVSNPNPAAVIVNNGQASGTIQLWYTYIGSSFPCGQFATFNLNLAGKLGSGKVPSYPVELDLVQSGQGTPVQFSDFTTPFSVTSASWSGSTPVTVSIDCSQLSAPYDGQEIVGNLNEGANPQGAHLDTVSTIQVHIKLMYPTACLKLYSLETDENGNLLSAVTVNANRFGIVKSSSPGEVWIDGMFANTCSSSQSFDMAIGVGDDWQLNPNNNAGNATFTYSTSGEIDPSSFNLTLFGTGTKQGETLCLSNVTVAPNDTFLATEHAQIVSGIAATSLDNYNSTTKGGTFSYSATLYTAGSGCSGPVLGNVTPSNPGTSSVSYTVQ